MIEVSLGWDLNRGPPDLQLWCADLCAIKASLIGLLSELSITVVR